VTVNLDQSTISVKGPQGALERTLHPEMMVAINENQIEVTRPSDSRRHRALHGLTRALVANMVNGVNEGFKKSLEIIGVGYKVEMKGSSLFFTSPWAFHTPFYCMLRPASLWKWRNRPSSISPDPTESWLDR
jgi:large subunit ribosomal protein L6